MSEKRGHKRDDSQASYYFVSHEVGASDAVVIEEMPQGTNAEAFAPRTVNKISPSASPMIRRPKQTAVQETAPPAASTSDQGNAGLFAAVFGTSDRYSRLTAADISGAKKVDPKVFFSKERTFLAWMHTSLWLAGASMAITAYSDTGTVSAIYGLMMLPVAIIFIIYAMLQYAKRSYMLQTRSPGPYEDRWGPVVLGTIFVASLCAQFIFKLVESAKK